MRRFWLTFLLCVAGLPAWAFNKTAVKLLVAEQTVKPGETVWAGLEMKMARGWHTYWRYGGDAGIPTSIEWNLPKGVTAEEIQWPIPRKQVDKISEETTLVTYIYSNVVVLPVRLRIGESVGTGPLEIKGTAKWQECADICVMAQDDVSATLTIGDADKKSAEADEIEEWRKRLPGMASGEQVSVKWEGATNKDNRDVVIEWKTNVAGADFYPFSNADFDVGGLTKDLPGDGEVRLEKTITKSGTNWPTRLAGILVGKAGAAGEFAEEIEAPIGEQGEKGTTGGDVGASNIGKAGPSSLAVMLAFALIGGLILNVMPCVLPVIALKILGFVNQAAEHPRRVRQLGLVYGLGVLASFFALAALAIAAQRAGGVANWGDAIRNPQFQVIITVMITLVALNLFGVFEVTLSGRALGAATTLASRSGFGGAFFNGVLATVLATPCTAPFLGAALAFAFTQPPLVTILVFETVGLGLALPFVVICLEPRLLKFLPKPGAWMERFKVAMGFPMMATAVWLLWVSARGEDDVLWLGLFLVVVAAAAWVWGEFGQRLFRRVPAALGAVALLAFGYFVLLEGQLQWRRPVGAVKEGITWRVWSPEAVDEARREGHPVLVDFTAKSCLNCKFNKARSIEIKPTRKKLKEIGAVAFEADYTYEDPQIGQELRRFNRPGVPLVLVYPKDLSKPPEILPPLFSPSEMLSALAQAAD